MSRAVNAVVVGIAVFVLAVSGLWYVYVVAQRDAPPPAPLELEWGNVTANGTTLFVTVLVENERRVDAVFESIAIEAKANGELVASAEEAPAERLRAREEVPVRLALRFPPEFPGEWWRAHVGDRESTVFTLTGQAVLRVGDREATVPIDHREEWRSDVASSLGEKVKNCPEPGGPCLRESRHEWARDGDGTLVLRSRLRLENPTDEPLVLGPRRVSLHWGNETVGQAEEDHLIRLDPGASEVVELALALRQDPLAAWWTAHVQACERTPVALTVRVLHAPEPEDVEEDDVEPPPEENETPPPDNDTDNGTGDNGTGDGNDTENGTENGTGNGSANGSDDGDDLPFPPPPRAARDWLTDSLLGLVGLLQPEEGEEPAAREAVWRFPVTTLRSEFACAGTD